MLQRLKKLNLFDYNKPKSCVFSFGWPSEKQQARQDKNAASNTKDKTTCRGRSAVHNLGVWLLASQCYVSVSAVRISPDPIYGVFPRVLLILKL